MSLNWHCTCFVHAMRKLTICILFLAALASLALAQDADAQKRFAGTWVAKVHDKVICTIKLEAAQPITGAMHACQINIDGDGQLIEPEESRAEVPGNEPLPAANDAGIRCDRQNRRTVWRR